MPKIKYVDQKLGPEKLALVKKANEIIGEYEHQGFELTLRQLYYQFVARDIIPNNLRSYKNLGTAINDGRMVGLIDWDHITDRTRNLVKRPSWDSPSARLKSAADSHHVDMWARQQFRPEVWIEKDALVGVIEAVCWEFSVPYFSCRGYTSQSEMWGAAQRLASYRRTKQTPVIFHFGDHDPSGKDMTRDIIDRIELFTGRKLKLERKALNMDQIEQYEPPPNPAKLTDSRAQGYVAEFGDDSWELDALEPSVITDLIRESIEPLINDRVWKEDEARKEKERRQLTSASQNWDEIRDHFTNEDEE